LVASYTVRVPATSANLGPGFDLLGLAVPFYNRVKVSPAATLDIINAGPESTGLPTDVSHLVQRSAEKLFNRLGAPIPTWRLELDVQIPQSRGMGSSSAAIVMGLVAANHWLGGPLDQSGILALATDIEGHPDNVGPAIYGGVTAAFTDGDKTHCLVLAQKPPCALVMAVPAFELSTAEARKALPPTYSRSDVVANLGHVTILTTVMLTGAVEWLPYGLQDRIHQPYRLPLVPGAEAVGEAARNAGAWGVVISGAGPTLLALAPGPMADEVANAMTVAWSAQGIASRTLVFHELAAGACVEPPA
jgi:homoserine kinase